MTVLGIWDGHDAGAAIVSDGRILAAINEERLTRRKLEIGFPERSIAACLNVAGLTARDVDVVAGSTTDPSKALGRLFPSTRESYYRIRRRQAQPGLRARLLKRSKYWLTELPPNRLSAWANRAALQRSLASAGLGDKPLRLHDHHYCHAIGAAAASGFDAAIVLTIDGVGDGACATVSVLRDGALTELERTPARHSPGIFFEHVTNLLNMRELEDEGKVMALASYSPAPHSNPLSAMLTADGLRFRTSRAGHSLRASLAAVQWSHPNEQLARMAQDTLEQAAVQVVSAAIRQTSLRRIALGGGVASNIQMNRRLRLLPEVEELFVFPHMGDGGLAIGAALAEEAQRGSIREVDLRGLALGPEYSDAEIAEAVHGAGFVATRVDAIAETVADLLAARQVVMWFQGPMECGPRALGGRSILARADDPAMRDRLNLVLKRRVWFQPFCPSILESDARRLLSDWRGRPDRFMTMAYTVAPDCRKALAGVTGVDGTCRPQVVADDAPGRWAELLLAMRSRVGAAAVLNTSFNIHGEPLVCTPADAIDVFKRSGADALACGPFVIKAPR